MAAIVRCVVCGDRLDADSGLVLASGRLRLAHCSEVCLEETVQKQMRTRTVRRLWTAAGASVVALLLVGVWMVKRHRAPQSQAISYAWPETVRKDQPAPSGPALYGPAWPPTDDDWMFAFGRVSWSYPLPGPARRRPVADDRRFNPGGICRTTGACGVRLGGELWGEHVYAVLDGVVDRAQGGGNDDHGGGYVRIAHFGGMVFTHYYHLAAIPRGVRRGARVAAGEVIGLVGDTGTRDEAPASRPHLHFAFSIRPSSEMAEVFWDPAPLMARWLLRVPPHGTVAGLAVPVNDEDLLRRRRGR
jgi:murein DD-endopeptidase MepM/ murein hydrolase activator NlpD